MIEAGTGPWAALAARAARAAGVEGALELAQELASELPLPGRGRTAAVWSALATLGSADLTAARVVEPHLDAVAILAEAGVPAPSGAWGVWAAEQPGVRLAAEADGDGWRLRGVKPWCSLADRLDGALVTAHVDGGRRLFAVDLAQPGWTFDPAGWRPLGLGAVTTGPVRFDGVPARPVGDVGWYLRRPGFAWGGIGVAACWWGAAAALRTTLLTAAARREPDQIALALLGRADRVLHAAGAALSAAADDVDAGRGEGADGSLLALRVRGAVAAAAEEVLAIAGHALGPGPLTADPVHVARVADLTVYLRQHHAERDDAALGRALVSAAAE